MSLSCAQPQQFQIQPRRKPQTRPNSVETDPAVVSDVSIGSPDLYVNQFEDQEGLFDVLDVLDAIQSYNSGGSNAFETKFNVETPRYENRRIGPSGACRVCGDQATGMYFGALVCVPCKTFFLRYAGDGFAFVCKNSRSCDITVASRTQCKFCRYQKCLSAGMHRRVRPAQVQVTDGQQTCAICHDVANGIHFGVITCEGCKKFFRRGLVENGTYVCKNNDRCQINPQTRNTCRLCRYKKCLAVGMSREAIQMGRPSKPRYNVSPTAAMDTTGVYGDQMNENHCSNQGSENPHPRNLSPCFSIRDSEPDLKWNEFEYQSNLTSLVNPSKNCSLSDLISVMSLPERGVATVRGGATEMGGAMGMVGGGVTEMGGATGRLRGGANGLTFAEPISDKYNTFHQNINNNDGNIVTMATEIEPYKGSSSHQPGSIKRSENAWSDAVGSVTTGSDVRLMNGSTSWSISAGSTTGSDRNFVPSDVGELYVLRIPLLMDSTERNDGEGDSERRRDAGEVGALRTEGQNGCVSSGPFSKPSTDDLLRSPPSDANSSFNSRPISTSILSRPDEKRSNDEINGFVVGRRSTSLSSSSSRSTLIRSSLRPPIAADARFVNCGSPYESLIEIAESCGLLSKELFDDDDDSCLSSKDSKTTADFDIEEHLSQFRQYWAVRETSDDQLICQYLGVILDITSCYKRFVESSTRSNRSLSTQLRHWPKDLTTRTFIKEKVVPIFTHSSINYFKSLPEFKNFCEHDKKTLIRFGQSPSRILVAAVHWYNAERKDFDDFLCWRQTDLFKEMLIEYAAKIHELKLDLIEAALLNSMIVIASDYPDLQFPQLIEDEHKKLRNTLKAYTTARLGTPNKRVEELLNHMFQVRKLGFIHFKMTLTKTITAEELAQS